jgi:GntR family transcriptional regulator/MocR family aminotransferase
VAIQIGPVGDWAVLLGLQRGPGGTLHEQLEARLRELIRGGRLGAGTRLPSSRALAGAIGVSRGIVLEAYAQLVAEGYLTASQGAATRVAASAVGERPPLRASSLLDERRTRLAPDRPDLAAFPRDSWLRSLRTALREAPIRALDDADPRGVPELRDALMDYLVRARAAAPEPEHMLISAGFSQGFAVLCAALAARGLETIAVEAPGWTRHRLIAERAGLTPVEIAVDAHGLRVEELATSGCETVVVTPAHQYPSGVVLSAERRGELLEWAEDGDGLIVEDDYDSELRYDRVGVGALQGLAPERVCQIGSTSKRLAPGIRIGWTLSPSWLSGALTYEQAVLGVAPPVLMQLALADFITRGELDRHLRRMRARYGAARERLLAALAAAVPSAVIGGVPAGLFVPVSLPGAGETLGLGEPVQEAGIDLLLGFAGQTAAAIEDGVARLGEKLIARPISFRRRRRFTGMNSLLTDRHAVIYGGGGAIGAGVAATFVREGAHVHLVGRTREPMERVAADVAGRADIAVLDATDPEAVEAHLATLPRVDVSFNLVSRGDVQGRPLHELSVEEVMRPVLGIRSNLITARAAVRRMREQRSGVILWLTSGSGTGAAPGMGGTGPADAATDNYMRQLARENGHDGVRVCGIWTAGVYETFLLDGDTNVSRRASGMTAARIDELIGGMAALGRAPRLQEVADAAAFLASDRASGTTGTVLNVTAGLVAER